MSNTTKIALATLVLVSSVAFAAESLKSTGASDSTMPSDSAVSSSPASTDMNGMGAVKATDAASTAVMQAQQATEAAKIATDAAKVANDVAKVATDRASEATSMAKSMMDASGSKGTAVMPDASTTPSDINGSTMPSDMNGSKN